MEQRNGGPQAAASPRSGHHTSDAKHNGRAAYREVGAAMRGVLARAAGAKLTPRQHRVLLAVLYYTATWSKLTDRVAVGQIAELTGIDRRHVRSSLRELAALGLIVYQHGDSPKGGLRVSSTIGLPPGAEAGPRLPGAEAGPRLPGADTGPRSGSDRGPAAGQTGGQSRSGPGAGAGPPPEKYSEEDPEAAASPPRGPDGPAGGSPPGGGGGHAAPEGDQEAESDPTDSLPYREAIRKSIGSRGGQAMSDRIRCPGRCPTPVRLDWSERIANRVFSIGTCQDCGSVTAVVPWRDPLPQEPGRPRGEPAEWLPQPAADSYAA